MTTTTAQASPPVPVDTYRRTALVVGVLFVVTYVTSIPAKFFFYEPLLEHADYILGSGNDTQVLWGAFAEAVLIIANIGTAVALYPLLRRQHAGLAMGFVTARVMESVFIAVGILSVLTLVTLRQDFAATGEADSATLALVGDALVALQEWTFALGPNFVVGLGNGLILGYLMYRSGLIPRGMAMLGMVAGSLIVVFGTGLIFGVVEQGSPWQAVLGAPEFVWELSFGIYLIVKGFKPSPLTTGSVHAS
jgi:hypothetical protein